MTETDVTVAERQQAPTAPKATGAPESPRPRRLSQHSRKAVLTWHVGSSVGWLGTGLGVLALAVGGDPSAAHLLSLVPGLPLAVLSGLTGSLLALGTPWRLFRHWWVLTKFVLHKVVLGSWLFVLMPGLDDAAAGSSASTGAVVSGAVASLLLVVALALSIAKPFGRIRGKDGRIRAPRP